MHQPGVAQLAAVFTFTKLILYGSGLPLAVVGFFVHVMKTIPFKGLKA